MATTIRAIPFPSFCIKIIQTFMQFSLKSIHCIIHHWQCKNCLCISKHPNRRNISRHLYMIFGKLLQSNNAFSSSTSLKQANVGCGLVFHSINFVLNFASATFLIKHIISLLFPYHNTILLHIAYQPPP